ncbi:Energy-coupling factor transporter transmembrane protein EcfT [Methanolapillus millepedarum]|uniref:Energy-coupling factor transporter transmembrane protein EcfT n=2 Tax=Methanolapillus millepedarum TaxID=3028296 RepID=A0AA96ZV98_9EURY|nr:Energy-coupling factor transporter transmembrane protein EcfT [Methanosarcinaceae archaeon Ac7]
MKLPSETYSAIDAPIQRMNPMTKVIVFLLLIFSVSFVKSMEMASFVLLLSVLIWILSKLPVSYVLKRMAAPLLFVFIFAVALLFSVGGADGGDIVGSVWIFNITSAGISEAVLILVRATAALLLITILLGTTKFDLIVKVLYDLKVPIFILQILMFSYRYIFVFSKEMESMKNSMASKGFTPKISMRSLTAAANTIAMLFINGFERADAVYQSMVSKGYTGKPAIITKNQMHAKDYVIVVMGIIIAVGIQIPAIVSYLSNAGI